jgi:Tol biopolymer transport system component
VKKMLPFVAVILAAALASLPAPATTPGRNGQLIYAKFPSLWVVSPDGSGAHKLPWIKQSESLNPDWSPDGRRIAFERCASNCEVWTARADGTAAKRLGPDCLRKPDDACIDRSAPVWSPDGKQLAFGQGTVEVTSNEILKGSEIYVMNADGGGVRRVTNVTAGKPFLMDVNFPAWSPDGKRLVFEVKHFAGAEPPNRRALFIVDVDGSGLRQLTPWELNGGDHADWAPDGSRILFRAVSTAESHSGNLYTIRPDGSQLQQLTHYPSPKTVLLGSFSPDGRWIVFSRFTDTPYPGLYVLRADGTGLRRIGSENQLYSPDWGPAPG